MNQDARATRLVKTRYGMLSVPDTETDLIGRFLVRYGEWAWPEAAFAASVLPDTAHVLDAGAFLGTFGLGVAKLQTLGLLCCVEANPAVTPFLRANIRDNADCPSVVVEALVTGLETSVASGSLGEAGNLGSMTFATGEQAGATGEQAGTTGEQAGATGEQASSVAIPAMTLAELRAAHGVFDLIKLDIEGMELEALSGDEAFLRTGRSALWIEANEDPRCLDVARLLLTWNLPLYYFSFPAFNPDNFNRHPDPVFPFAHEAALLASPARVPVLSAEAMAMGCVLKPVTRIDELKDALWRTPRWGMADWEHGAPASEVVALAGRSLLGQSFGGFLARSPAAPRRTIWEQLDEARTALASGLADRESAREEARDARTLASEQSAQAKAERVRREYVEARLNEIIAQSEERANRLNALDVTMNARLLVLEDKLREAEHQAGATRDEAAVEAVAMREEVAERRRLLDVEQRGRVRLEETLREAETISVERAARLSTIAQHRDQIEANLRDTAALAAERLEHMLALEQALRLIRGSTVWRASAPMRAVIGHHPALRAMARKASAALRLVARKARRPTSIALQPAWVPVSGVAGLIEAPLTAETEHHDLVRPYFDAAYYLAANPDIRGAGIDPLDHFLLQGWREGRAPGHVFDVGYYLANNPDVAAAGINPVLHYVWEGKAEGRLARRPLDMARAALAAAASPHEMLLHWTAAADRSAPLTAQALAAVLGQDGDGFGTVVAVSHDDYAINFGGIQNVIADEQRALNAAGWRYVHLSPASPGPLLADHGPAVDYLLRVRLNGTALGVARFPDLAACLATGRARGGKTAFVFHQLLGHVPELLATLPLPEDGPAYVWVHDFFTLCPSFSMMRNNVKFCGGPPAGSPACTVCVYGGDRRSHVPRMRAFFRTLRPIVAAPSAVTLQFWLSQSGLTHAGTMVVPPARLIMRDREAPVTPPSGRALRVAHLGANIMHKGWHVFEDLVLRHTDDSRYQFYHLGTGGTPSSNYIHDPVRVGPDQRDGMIEAIVRHEIDVVICWSLWPETFSFTVHEALAGGAFVVARRAAGNMWPAVRAHAPEQGCAVDDEAALVQLFESGEIVAMASAAPRHRGVLHPGGNAAELLLAGRAAPRDLAAADGLSS